MSQANDPREGENRVPTVDENPEGPYRGPYNSEFQPERPRGRFELPGLWFLVPLAGLVVAGFSLDSIFTNVHVALQRSIGVDRFDSSLLWAGLASFCLLYFPKIQGREARDLWEPFVVRKTEFIVLGVFIIALLAWQSLRETSHTVRFFPNRPYLYCDSDLHPGESRNISEVGGIVHSRFKGRTRMPGAVYCNECWNAEIANQH